MKEVNEEESRTFYLWDLGLYLQPYTLALSAAGLAMAAKAAVLMLAPWPLKFMRSQRLRRALLVSRDAHWTGARGDRVRFRAQDCLTDRRL
jgi:hypothetical protein